MREIKQIVVHCSASQFGSALEIDRWHRERGFKSIGYHFVILNGFPHAGEPYSPHHDGAIESGRALMLPGAHAEGHNADSVGVCLIADPERKDGRPVFTRRQLESLHELAAFLMRDFSMAPASILGHCELDPAKPKCPGLPMDSVRQMMAADTARKADEIIDTILKGESNVGID